MFFEPSVFPELRCEYADLFAQYFGATCPPRVSIIKMWAKIAKAKMTFPRCTLWAELICSPFWPNFARKKRLPMPIISQRAVSFRLARAGATPLAAMTAAAAPKCVLELTMDPKKPNCGSFLIIFKSEKEPDNSCGSIRDNDPQPSAEDLGLHCVLNSDQVMRDLDPELPIPGPMEAPAAGPECEGNSLPMPTSV